MGTLVLIHVDARVELRLVDADPLVGLNRDDVLASYDLLSLPPFVVDADLHRRFIAGQEREAEDAHPRLVEEEETLFNNITLVRHIHTISI